ncbi:MAG TPA: hypothetical protein VM939_11435 [Gemmatimonadaceae bacterium]|nr:hypothetical protein [Gemmatimonadaceae bacterium]
MRAFLIAATLAIATACATPSQPGSGGDVVPSVNAQLGTQFDLSAGQAARISGTPITIHFRRVAEDSRCPVDVQCVWAGNGKAEVTLTATGFAKSDAVLNTGIEPLAVTYAGYRISLPGLKPAPRAGVTIPAGNYVATFEVTAP